MASLGRCLIRRLQRACMRALQVVASSGAAECLSARLYVPGWFAAVAFCEGVRGMAGFCCCDDARVRVGCVAHGIRASASISLHVWMRRRGRARNRQTTPYRVLSITTAALFCLGDFLVLARCEEGARAIMCKRHNVRGFVWSNPLPLSADRSILNCKQPPQSGSTADAGG